MRIKYLHQIPGYENFFNYAIDTEGNVWSFKSRNPKKLKTSYKNIINGKKYGEYVSISNKKGEKTSVTIQRLMCLAFLEKSEDQKKIKHINGNRKDNSIDNLEWVTKKENLKDRTYQLDSLVYEKLKKAHIASIHKGLNPGDLDSFIAFIVNKALDDYINQYGLRKLLM